VLQTVGTPVYLALRGTPGDKTASGLLFSALGGVGLVFFVVTFRAVRVVPESRVTMVGFVCLMAGTATVAVASAGPCMPHAPPSHEIAVGKAHVQP
jgi:hypothetical protein